MLSRILLILLISLSGLELLAAEKDKSQSIIKLPKLSIPKLFKKKNPTFFVKTPAAVAGVKGKATFKSNRIKEKVMIHLEKSYFDKKFYWTPAKVKCKIIKTQAKKSYNLSEFELNWGENLLELDYKQNEVLKLVFIKNKDSVKKKTVDLRDVTGKTKQLFLK
jgi:hypothetical protein